MSEADADTERVAITARVPAYQKEAWVADAESKESAANTGDPEGASPDVDPRGSGLEDRLLAALDREGVMSFDELVETVAGDVEQRVDETMEEMMSNRQVTYSGRDGGYVPVER